MMFSFIRNVLRTYIFSSIIVHYEDLSTSLYPRFGLEFEIENRKGKSGYVGKAGVL